MENEEPVGKEVESEEGKTALFWEKLGNNVRCELCPRLCFLREEEIGKCRVRQNINGRLVTLVYNKPCSLAVDPIEKKPFYHFLPGEQTLSVATAGCNFSCSNCQNWQISQQDLDKIKSLNIDSRDIVKEAEEEDIKIIAYTYTEPTIFYEYMIDIARLARKKQINNVIVTNGYINPKPLRELCKYIDASNIDLKAFDRDFYKNICSANLEPVLRTIKIMRDKAVWIEITNLIVPGLNDSYEQINNLVDWIRNNLGSDVPLHFSAFYPQHKLTSLPSTPLETLKKARNIAMAKGLNYVYIGNIEDEEGGTTFCPKCKKALIRRKYFSVVENKLKNGKCSYCQAKIAGIWR